MKNWIEEEKEKRKELYDTISRFRSYLQHDSGIDVFIPEYIIGSFVNKELDTEFERELKKLKIDDVVKTLRHYVQDREGRAPTNRELLDMIEFETGGTSRG